MDYVLISFESPHHTVKADKILEKHSFYRMVYPIPREISLDCGLGIRIAKSDLQLVIKLFEENQILYKNIFQIDQKDQTSLIDHFLADNQQ